MLPDITLRELVLQLSFSKCRSLWSYSLHTNTGSWGTKLGPHTLNFHPRITSRHILQRNKLSSVHKMYWSVHQLHGCVSVNDSLNSVLLHTRVCVRMCVCVQVIIKGSTTVLVMNATFWSCLWPSGISTTKLTAKPDPLNLSGINTALRRRSSVYWFLTAPTLPFILYLPV